MSDASMYNAGDASQQGAGGESEAQAQMIALQNQLNQALQRATQAEAYANQSQQFFNQVPENVLREAIQRSQLLSNNNPLGVPQVVSDIIKTHGETLRAAQDNLDSMYEQMQANADFMALQVQSSMAAATYETSESNLESISSELEQEGYAGFQQNFPQVVQIILDNPDLDNYEGIKNIYRAYHRQMTNWAQAEATREKLTPREIANSEPVSEFDAFRQMM